MPSLGRVGWHVWDVNLGGEITIGDLLSLDLQAKKSLHTRHLHSTWD